MSWENTRCLETLIPHVFERKQHQIVAVLKCRQTYFLTPQYVREVAAIQSKVRSGRPQGKCGVGNVRGLTHTAAPLARKFLY